MFLIAGLGNPGKKYEKTRHNMGFMAIDKLAERHHVSLDKSKFKSLIAEFNFKGDKVILMKPQTYMNLSGDAVREAVNFYKIDIKNVLVIYDDLDIPAGTLRIRSAGSPGTHNGMKSVVNQLGSQKFPRIRVGIGNENKGDIIDFVIGKMNKSDEQLLEETIHNAALAAECYMSDGIDIAMNRYNSSTSKNKKAGS